MYLASSGSYLTTLGVDGITLHTQPPRAAYTQLSDLLDLLGTQGSKGLCLKAPLPK